MSLSEKFIWFSIGIFAALLLREIKLVVALWMWTGIVFVVIYVYRMKTGSSPKQNYRRKRIKN